MTDPTTTPASTRHPGQPPTRHSKPPSERIIEAVANAADTSHHELPLLYEAVDPEALNHLFASDYGGTTRAPGQVTIEYAGYEVVVSSSDDVTVSPLDAASAQHPE
jgi:Halobacterial output domain 1